MKIKTTIIKNQDTTKNPNVTESMVQTQQEDIPDQPDDSSNGPEIMPVFKEESELQRYVKGDKEESVIKSEEMNDESTKSTLEPLLTEHMETNEQSLLEKQEVENMGDEMKIKEEILTLTEQDSTSYRKIASENNADNPRPRYQNFRGKRRGAPYSNRGHKRPKREDILREKLMEDSVRNERIALLQCIRYIVTHNFFQNPNQSSIQN